MTCLLGKIAFMSLSNFWYVMPFDAANFEGFLNISYFDPCLGWELCYSLGVVDTNVGTWSHFMRLIETLVDVPWDFEPFLD